MATDSPERKPVEDVREETEAPVEETGVELTSDQTGEKPDPSEEKTEDDTCTNQDVDHSENKVTQKSNLCRRRVQDAWRIKDEEGLKDQSNRDKRQKEQGLR